MSIPGDGVLSNYLAATPARADLGTRAWVLLLLDSVSRIGLSPVSKLRYHRIAYIANCLAAVSGVRAIDERILKHRRGPFYADLQWHLDRLVGLGLARISRVRHFTDATGPWMDANYSITRAGVGVVEMMQTVDVIATSATFLLEVAKAYAAQEDNALDDLALSDVMYDDYRRATGSVIEFRRLVDNFSARAAHSFAALAPDTRALTAHDRIHLYVEYLDEQRRRRRERTG